MDTHRIKVKLGDAEFDAEGSPEAVQAQYDAFLAAVAAVPRKTPDSQAQPVVVGAAALATGQATVNGVGAVSGVATGIMERVFRQGDTLSLAALPRGDNAAADAMLALLYAYLRLKNEGSVTGTLLMKSAKKSGVNIERVDRIMDRLTDFVLAAGVKKAKRYQLNNPGILRAEAIVNSILQ